MIAPSITVVLVWKMCGRSCIIGESYLEGELLGESSISSKPHAAGCAKESDNYCITSQFIKGISAIREDARGDAVEV
jgi:hypothetical protein